MKKRPAKKMEDPEEMPMRPAFMKGKGPPKKMPRKMPRKGGAKKGY